VSYTQGIFAAHAKQVIEDDIEGKLANTIIAYNWKAKEFIMYCQQVHPSSNSAVSNTTVIEETFLDSFCTSCVNPFEKKGRQKVGSQVEVFNKLEYFELMNNPTQKAQKPCGYSLLNQYCSAILDLHAMQRDNGCNNVLKDELMSDCIKHLLNNVKKRKLMVAKISFEEKLTAEFALYTTVKEVPRIEEYLF
jgi:hypothetical protein